MNYNELKQSMKSYCESQNPKGLKKIIGRTPEWKEIEEFIYIDGCKNCPLFTSNFDGDRNVSCPAMYFDLPTGGF